MTHSARPSLGVFGPGPRDRSGVSRYIADSLPHLAASFDCHWASNSAPADPSRFDAVLYHIGNNRMHHLAYRALRVRPGPVILHEFNILGYYLTVWSRLDDAERTRIHSLLAKHTDGSVNTIEEAAAHAERTNCPLPAWDIGVEALVLNNSTVGLVHSDRVADEMRRRHPTAHTNVLTFPVSTRDSRSRAEVCRLLGLPADRFLFGSLGFVSHHKQVHALVEAWRAWTDRPGDTALVIAGERMMPLPPTDGHDVYEFGYLPDPLFDALTNTIDCAVQLRHPTMGETSGVVSAFAAAGTDLIVSDTPANRDALRTGTVNIEWIPPGHPGRRTLISAMNRTYSRRSERRSRRTSNTWSDWLKRVRPHLHTSMASSHP